LTAKFALSGLPQENGPSTVTVSTSQPNSLTLDQVSLALSVTSPPGIGLSAVTGALSDAGITNATLYGVATSSNTTSSSYLWSFSLLVPFTQLSATLAELSTAAATIQQNNSGLSLSFGVTGLSSSQAQQPPSCSSSNLLQAAQSRATQIAAAAGLSLGPVLSLSNNGIVAETVVGGVLVPACGLTAQFQLYN
jgi:hypothetical protein